MKKQLIALFMAAIMLAVPVVSLAEDTADTPQTNDDVTVIVNGKTISFADQKPIITDKGRTLVPARGVFQAMNAKVTWNGETQTARFDSANNLIRILITNNDPIMTVYKFTSVIHADETNVTLDETPQIINDRTMVPLRAISESLGATVDWDNETRTATITEQSYTDKITSTDPDVKFIRLSLSADKTAVKTGDTVTLSVSASGLDKFDSYLNGVTTGVYYDKTKFQFDGYTAMIAGKPMEGALGTSNPDYRGDSVKAVAITTARDEKAKDGVVMELKFTALAPSNTTASFVLSDRYTMEHGADTTLTLFDGKNTQNLKQDAYLIDSTPLIVEISDDAPKATPAPSVEPTAEPSASPAPSSEPTASPEPTTAPEDDTTATPEPTASPEPTTVPTEKE